MYDMTHWSEHGHQYKFIMMTCLFLNPKLLNVKFGLKIGTCFYVFTLIGCNCNFTCITCFQKFANGIHLS